MAEQRSGRMYIGAPYNFVPFPNKVYQYPKEKLAGHGQLSKELVTGELCYEVEAQTQIMVDNGKGEFHKDAKGRYAIPGSTMRGLIRNNVQILGLSGYEDDIDDYALMYRNVASGAEKKRYSQILGAKQIPIGAGANKCTIGVLSNVRAGYVKNEGGKYYIYQTCVDSIRKETGKMNYYVLSERKIVEDYLTHKGKFSYPAFRPNGRNILQHEFTRFRREEYRGRVHYKGEPNKNYSPYYIPVSYEVANLKDVVAVDEPGKCKKEGYAVSTGKMNEKKVVYIIPKMDDSKPAIAIPQDDVRAFMIDLKKKEKTLKRFGGREAFDLPKEGEIKPVFYIQLSGRLYFGFTPRLRLFYDHTVKEGLRQKCTAGKIDYNKAIFGYSGPEGSYKSKVSFSDAVLLEDAKALKEQRLVLAEPKPTSYLDYLKPVMERGGQQKGVTYNTDDFELRGVKQYWLHKQAPVNTGMQNQKNENIASVFRPLDKHAKFKGKIRFQNLTQDELGLLLWAIRLDGNCWMNVGKAKAFGYGAVSVKITEAKKLDVGRAYDSEQMLDLNPFEDICINEAIEFYKAKMNHFLGSRKIDDLPHIKDFFRMKDPKQIPDDDWVRYMNLSDRGQDKEYQNRNKNQTVLPSIAAIVRRK